MSSQPQSTPSSVPSSELGVDQTRGWRTVVHDDPVNLMTYVEWVFMVYFAMDAETARALMLRVHERGRAVVSRGQREQMEADAQAMHTYGLWATIEEEE